MTRQLQNIGIVLGFATAMLIFGCNTGENPPDEQTTVDQVKTPHAVEDAATIEAGADTVIIKLMKFNPEQIHVKKGHTVVWINRGIVPHNVMQQPDTAFVSDTLAVGDMWKMKVNDGFDYICSIHPTMKAKVIVDP